MRNYDIWVVHNVKARFFSPDFSLRRDLASFFAYPEHFLNFKDSRYPLCFLLDRYREIKALMYTFFPFRVKPLEFKL